MSSLPARDGGLLMSLPTRDGGLLPAVESSFPVALGGGGTSGVASFGCGMLSRLSVKAPIPARGTSVDVWGLEVCESPPSVCLGGSEMSCGSSVSTPWPIELCPCASSDPVFDARWASEAAMDGVPGRIASESGDGPTAAVSGARAAASRAGDSAMGLGDGPCAGAPVSRERSIMPLELRRLREPLSESDWDAP
jgi:hypothetical protein